MIQGFMGLGEAVYWSQGGLAKLKEDLKEDPKVIRVDLPGRKGERFERNYYTLIGGDAIEALKVWLKERPENATGIFTDQFGRTLSKKAIHLYWHRHLISLGLIEKGTGPSSRSGKNIHEIRDCARTLWEKTPAKAMVAEFMMQHTIDENEYNKAFRDEAWMREEYRKALPWLNMMSSGRAYHQVSEDRVTELEAKIAEMEKDRETQRAKDRKEMMEIALGVYKELGALEKLEKEKQ
jgi:hypothetical protein